VFLIDTLYFPAAAYRSGKLVFEEKGEIDIRHLTEDFTDAMEEISLDGDGFSPEMDITDEDSESSDGRGGFFLGTGLLFGAAAAGFQSFSGMLGRSWENDDDDLGAVLSEVVDVDDINTSMGLGSNTYQASMGSAKNGLSSSNPVVPGGPPSGPPVVPTPGLETAA
jgi:hypothetical protein